MCYSFLQVKIDLSLFYSEILICSPVVSILIEALLVDL